MEEGEKEEDEAEPTNSLQIKKIGACLVGKLLLWSLRAVRGMKDER